MTPEQQAEAVRLLREAVEVAEFAESGLFVLSKQPHLHRQPCGTEIPNHAAIYLEDSVTAGLVWASIDNFLKSHAENADS